MTATTYKLWIPAAAGSIAEKRGSWEDYGEIYNSYEELLIDAKKEYESGEKVAYSEGDGKLIELEAFDFRNVISQSDLVDDLNKTMHRIGMREFYEADAEFDEKRGKYCVSGNFGDSILGSYEALDNFLKFVEAHIENWDKDEDESENNITHHRFLDLFGKFETEHPEHELDVI
jgi:hypothetical protein